MNTPIMLTRRVNALKIHFYPKTCRTFLANKGFCTAVPEKIIKDIPFEEINVPVPWGHIACVRWGPQNKKPILALHGWQDNAFSWKRLVQHLPSDVAILAIDYPGHGKSSWLPLGMGYRQIDTVFLIQRISKYFGWKSVPVFAHSMGAIGSFTHASFFPDDAEFLVLIDNIKPLTAPLSGLIDRLSKGVASILKHEHGDYDQDEPPSYPFDEAIEKLYIGGNKSIDKDKCHILLERGTAKSKKYPGKYYFTRDSRLKYILDHRYAHEDVKEMARRVKCPTLYFKFESWTYYEPIENVNEVVDILKEHNKNFEMHVVPGSHHGHVNNPEVLFPYLTNFLEKFYRG